MNSIQQLNHLYSNQATVGVVFHKTKYAPGHEKVYTYMIPDECIDSIECGDFGIVEKDGEYSLVEIRRVDETSKVDPDAQYRHKWLVGIVKREPYLERYNTENNLLQEMQKENPNRV